MMDSGMAATFSQTPVALVTASLSVLLALGLVGQTLALEPSDDLAYRPNFFQQMSRQPQSGGLEERAVPGQAMEKLSKLLSMKDWMSELFVPGQSAQSGDVQPPQDKRVFCNGFTGCGGRFRKQRRRQDRDGDRKRAAAVGAAQAGDNRESDAGRQGLDMALWWRAMHQLEKLQLDKARAVSKRLFCNNYGGCHNVGKRGSQRGQPRPSPDLALATGALPKLDFLNDGRQRIQGKRFFSGGFDGDIDNMIDSLR